MATMSARYTVIDNEVVAQERGGVRHQLVPDPLGSTVALYDDSGTKTDTFSYWPYGENSSRTGTTATPFQYIGAIGYYTDNSDANYIRARYYRKVTTCWISEDINPDINMYNYCYNNPFKFIDFDGKQAEKPPIADCGSAKGMRKVPCRNNLPQLPKAKLDVCNMLKNLGKYELMKCYLTEAQAQCLLNWCSKNPNIYCIDSNDVQCTGWCAFSCNSNKGQHPDYAIYVCVPTISTGGCKNTDFPIGLGDERLKGAILHEMIGVCGTPHEGGVITPENRTGDKCRNKARCIWNLINSNNLSQRRIS